MKNIRHWFIAAIALVIVLTGCASTGGVKIVRDSASVGPEARLVDIHTFRIKGSDESQMNRVAREWAKRLDADVVVIRVIDRPTGQLLFSVEAYRSPPKS